MTQLRPVTDKKLGRATLRTLVDKQLTESGIPIATATKQQGIKPLQAKEVLELGGPDSAGYLIPYYNVHGEDTGFYRVRLLSPQKRKGFKYWQPPGSPPAAYFPKTNIDWSLVARDPTIPVYITEGEKKALCACLNDMVTIGLGGVWSFGSKKRQQPLLPELAEFNWRRREVTLVYDTDIYTNDDVLAAAERFSELLMQQGALVYLMELPPKDEDAKGLDDHIVAYGVDEVLTYSTRAVAGEALWKMNREVALIMELGSYARDAFPGNIVSKDVIRNCYDNVFGPDGKPVFEFWHKWQYRRQYGALTYVPGAGRDIPNSAHGGLDFNTYQPPTLNPRRGPVKLWLDYVSQLVDGDQDAVRYLTWWCAHKVTRPGVKLTHSLIFHSAQEGTGKSMFFELLRPLVGPYNYHVVTSEEVHSGFNSWAKGKLLVVFNESQESMNKQFADRLKDVKTAHHVTVNEKFVPAYSIPNYVTMCFTSNRDIPHLLTADDRRHWVWHTTETRQPVTYFRTLVEWWEREGAAAVMWFFQNKVDLDEYDPQTAPPETRAKYALVHESRSPLESAVHALINEPTLFFQNPKLAERELWTVQALMPHVKQFVGGHERLVNNTSVGRVLRRLCGEAVHIKVPLPDGSTLKWRAYPIRNREFWDRPSRKRSDAARAEFEAHKGVRR